MSESGKPSKPARQPNRLENLILGCTVEEIPGIIPGVALAAALVAFVTFLTDIINSALGFKGLISSILVVMIVGILLRNLVKIPPIFTPGIGFCIRKVLRLGIIMMGIRLSFIDAIKIGAWGIPIIITVILAGLLITIYFSRLIKIPDRLATLIAVGSSICGASAIVAAAPGIEAKEEETTYAVANITIFGLIALVAYPFIMHVVYDGNITMIGLFLGTAIHETAQVAASGLIYDQTFAITTYPSVLDIATITKLVRNIMMAFVIPFMAFIYGRRANTLQTNRVSWGRRIINLFPLFILGFLVMAALRSVGDAGIQASGMAFGLWGSENWINVHQIINQWSGYVLATAMAGVGLSTSFKAMKGLGIKPFYVGFFAAIMVGVVALIMVFAIGRFVTI
jgi:uncharacterized integral membrane protein (TIGR00698 family)